MRVRLMSDCAGMICAGIGSSPFPLFPLASFDRPTDAAADGVAASFRLELRRWLSVDRNHRGSWVDCRCGVGPSLVAWDCPDTPACACGRCRRLEPLQYDRNELPLAAASLVLSHCLHRGPHIFTCLLFLQSLAGTRDRRSTTSTTTSLRPGGGPSFLPRARRRRRATRPPWSLCHATTNWCSLAELASTAGRLSFVVGFEIVHGLRRAQPIAFFRVLSWSF